MKRKLSRKDIAVLIANELMKNNANEKAARLQLRDKNENDLGGYCRSVVIEIIERELMYAGID
jgi:hypothetical protein